MQLYMYWTPTGFWEVSLTFLAALVGSYIVISFGEHQIHKHLMHRKRLPRRIYEVCRPLRSLVDDHIHLHHSSWYRNTVMSDDDYDPRNDIEIGPKETLTLLTFSSPFWIFLLYTCPLAGGTFLVSVLLHNRLWNPLHRTMHMPEDSFFTHWRVYMWLTRHHFMHHEQPNRNFNIFFPFADFVLGTAAKPEWHHVRAMVKLGYIRPRRPEVAVMVRRGIESARQAAFAGAAPLG